MSRSAYPPPKMSDGFQKKQWIIGVQVNLNPVNETLEFEGFIDVGMSDNIIMLNIGGGFLMQMNLCNYFVL